MDIMIKYRIPSILIIILSQYFSYVLFGQTTSSGSTSLSLSLADIHSMKEAMKRLNTIDVYVKREDPQLIVHLVNWYRYDPVDMERTMGWNGTGKVKDTIALTSKPLFGYYSCDDPGYIDWLLNFSKALGIDELNIDYEGGVDYPEEFAEYYKGRSWDSWFMDLLVSAEKYNMKISVMYEPKTIEWRLAVRQGKGNQVYPGDSLYQKEALKLLKSDVKKICDRFTIKKSEDKKVILNSAYKRVAGLPVIWVFWMTSGSLTENLWEQAVNELYNEGYAFVLVSNTYRDDQTGFDRIAQGMNPWLDQLFTGFQNQYRELWNAAQEAAGKGDYEEAKRIANQYIDEINSKGLNTVAPVRKVEGPGNFTITPLAIGFQDADVNAWGFRPPVYIKPYDRSHTEPGKLFRAFYAAARKSNNQWYMICSGDDIPEQTHMLIPDCENGFSGPYAISLMSAFLGKQPDLYRAIQITEKYVKAMYGDFLPDDVQLIFKEAYTVLPNQLEKEVRLMKQ